MTTPSTSDPTKPLILWGTGNLAQFAGPTPASTAEDAVLDALDILQAHGTLHIDTAQRYGNGTAETILGQALKHCPPNAFTVDTKWAVDASSPNTLTPDTLTATAHSSAARLPPIDTFYLHTAPHPDTDLLPLLRTIDALHSQNLFHRFGLSNFTPAQVIHTHDLCTQHNLVAPTVYQGMFNALSRTETQNSLLPALRSRSIAFRAFSPVAGGFLTKSRSDLADPATAGRFGAALANTPGAFYRDVFHTEDMLAVLDRWGEVATLQAEREGGARVVGRAELAYRWVVWHGGLDGARGDGVVLGARNTEQLRETLGFVDRGRLHDDVVALIEELTAGK